MLETSSSRPDSEASYIPEKNTEATQDTDIDETLTGKIIIMNICYIQSYYIYL